MKPRVIFSFLFLPLVLFLISGCDYKTEEFKRHGFEKHVYVPAFPVVFVPGLGYTGKLWEKSKTINELRRLGWKYGGEIKVITNESGVTFNPKTLKAAHIYTVTFSSADLSIAKQGSELAHIIHHVLKFNDANKVILIGHSMGGLTCRQYLQSGAYGGNVAGFISVGTPHLGSDFNLEKIPAGLVPESVRKLIWKVDPRSDAVRDLRWGSIFLKGGLETDSPDYYLSKDIDGNGKVGDIVVGLNNFELRPLPQDVYYATVIGGGCPLISTRDQCRFSDGIVRVQSQDFNQLPGINVKGYVLRTDKDHFGEPDDKWILIKALRPLLTKP